MPSKRPHNFTIKLFAMIKQIQILVVTLLCWNTSTYAQQTLNVSGHSARINGMTFDYSIGEMVLVSTERSSQFIITQGVLQPTSTSATVSEESAGGLDRLTDGIKIYPNPSDNLVFVEWQSLQAGKLSYRLYDATGKVVLSRELEQQIGSNKTSLELGALAVGTYYLMLDGISGSAEQQSFKIQKTR